VRHVDEDTFLVTTAGKSPREELRQRTRRYLVTMGIRVVCFILAIVLYELDLHWEAAFAIAGSLILPWVAVVAANAGPTRGEVSNPSLYVKPVRREVARGPSDRPEQERTE
jgi:Protein of unknown function (DUF3099)